MCNIATILQKHLFTANEPACLAVLVVAIIATLYSIYLVKIMEGVRSIHATEYGIFALKNDDSLWTWDGISAICTGTGLDRTPYSPAKVMDNVNTVFLAKDGSCNFVNKTDGTLWAWGNSSMGALGTGKMLSGSLPAQVFFDGNSIPGQVDSAETLPKETPSSWAAEEINAAVAANLVPENLKKNYTQAISRGEVAQMLINMVEKTAGQQIDEYLAGKGTVINSHAFSDSSDPAVLAANALGLIHGMGDGRFDPDETLTRAQIAAIVNRYAIHFGTNVSGYSHNFNDVSEHWVNSELGWPVYAGIINGVGNGRFDPEGKLTTEQAIVIVYRALHRFVK